MKLTWNISPYSLSGMSYLPMKLFREKKTKQIFCLTHESTFLIIKSRHVQGWKEGSGSI